jgi:hypothetical protein
MIFTTLFLADGQEYKVISLDIEKNDLTARTKARVDANGRKCAVLKIYVDDQIVEARGSVVGNIEAIGMEKQVYLAHDAKQVELVFQQHYPLKIIFMDYDIPSLTGQMTYVCKLKPADTQSSSAMQSNTSDVQYSAEHKTTSAKVDKPTNSKERPLKKDIRILVLDAETKEPLIGAIVLKNFKVLPYEFDNWEIGNSLFTCDESAVTDLDGISPIFKDLKPTDEIECQYANFKSKRVKIPFDTTNKEQIYTIELTPYDPQKDEGLLIHVGGMGVNDNGSVMVTNSRTNEQFKMSQNTFENNLRINVRIGDILLFSRNGFKPISVEFKYSIPAEIKIGPIRGDKSDTQFLLF